MPLDKLAPKNHSQALDEPPSLPQLSYMSFRPFSYLICVICGLDIRELIPSNDLISLYQFGNSLLKRNVRPKSRLFQLGIAHEIVPLVGVFPQC